MSTVITTKSLMQRVLDTANFTPMQADIFIELCKETYNNEGIALASEAGSASLSRREEKS